MALINKDNLGKAHTSVESETKKPDIFSYWLSVIDSELLSSYAGIKAQDCSVPEEYWSSYEVDCCKTN